MVSSSELRIELSNHMILKVQVVCCRKIEPVFIPSHGDDQHLRVEQIVSEKFLWEIVQRSLTYNPFRFNSKSHCLFNSKSHCLLSYFSQVNPVKIAFFPCFWSPCLCFCAPEPTLVFLRNSAMFLHIWLLHLWCLLVKRPLSFLKYVYASLICCVFLVEAPRFLVQSSDLFLKSLCLILFYPFLWIEFQCLLCEFAGRSGARTMAQ
jgi:hypothetical protein